MRTAAGSYEDLVRYLLMVRKKVKEPKVDSELLYAYARTNNLGEIDAFLHTSHQANLQTVGDRCAQHCRGVAPCGSLPCTGLPVFIQPLRNVQSCGTASPFCCCDLGLRVCSSCCVLSCALSPPCAQVL